MTPELSAAFGGLVVAVLGATTALVVSLGIVAVGYVRKRGALFEAELELKRAELEEHARTRLRRAAADVAAIVDEQSRGTPGGALSGQVKAELAKEKLKELEPAARVLEGSQLTDIVRLGVAQFRASGTTYLVTPSQAPPPDVVHQGASEDRPTLPPLKRPLLPTGKDR